MTCRNVNNVYKGADSVRDYFDPDKQPMLPLVEIPPKLNPFYDDGVRIYAKMMTMLPANNVKALPALNMLQNAVGPETKTIIEYSSGSTVISMSLIARAVHGIHDTRAFLSNKTSHAKLQLMRFFGLNITLFGGPSQPEPTDHRGGIYRAELLSQQAGANVVNPNQYMNDKNWHAHHRWTAPQIFAQLPDIDVVCCGMGTSGTMTGIGTYFKEAKPSVFRLGVCTKAGDRVPGPRSFALMSPVQFPWHDAIDDMEEVGSPESYRLSLELSREGLICGPSSGFNLQGLCNFLARRKAQGTLDSLRAGKVGGGDRDRDQNIHCVFVACDLPYQYLDDYFAKLGEQTFHPIINEDLLHVDLYRYDEAWELDVETGLKAMFPPSCAPADVLSSTQTGPSSLMPSNIILDLRTADDFGRYHLPGAISRPLASLSPSTPSPFSDPSVLQQQWRELKAVFDVTTLGLLKHSACIWLVCYDGDTSRVATSILRAQGLTANSLRGGLAALASTTHATTRGQSGASSQRSSIASVDSAVELSHPPAGLLEKGSGGLEASRTVTSHGTSVQSLGITGHP